MQSNVRAKFEFFFSDTWVACNRVLQSMPKWICELKILIKTELLLMNFEPESEQVCADVRGFSYCVWHSPTYFLHFSSVRWLEGICWCNCTNVLMSVKNWWCQTIFTFQLQLSRLVSSHLLIGHPSTVNLTCIMSNLLQN